MFFIAKARTARANFWIFGAGGEFFTFEKRKEGRTKKERRRKEEKGEKNDVLFTSYYIFPLATFHYIHNYDTYHIFLLVSSFVFYLLNAALFS